ncbi:hypothetical protein DSUL_50157 [Desulfovibrionales bacterium]
MIHNGLTIEIMATDLLTTISRLVYFFFIFLSPVNYLLA